MKQEVSCMGKSLMKKREMSELDFFPAQSERGKKETNSPILTLGLFVWRFVWWLVDIESMYRQALRSMPRRR